MQGALKTPLHSPQDVRCALARLMIDLGPPTDILFDSDVIQLVLAEALNNIQEHGQLPPDATVSITWQCGSDLTVTIHDNGQPCPMAVIANATLPEPDHMAEGGYGWGLIQALCARVHYINNNGQNTLTLVFGGQ